MGTIKEFAIKDMEIDIKHAKSKMGNLNNEVKSKYETDIMEKIMTRDTTINDFSENIKKFEGKYLSRFENIQEKIDSELARIDFFKEARDAIGGFTERLKERLFDRIKQLKEDISRMLQQDTDMRKKLIPYDKGVEGGNEEPDITSEK
jgi:hypothetical protein